MGKDALFKLPPFALERVAVPLAETPGWHLKSLGVPQLWKRYGQGKDRPVAVLDTGIARKHPDFAGAVLEAVDVTDSRHGPEDHFGHGTHVAGVVAARRNGRGGVGVGPEIPLYSCKVVGDGGFGRAEWIAAGIEWAVRRGAKVIVMSLGCPKDEPALRAATKAAFDAGVVVVAAAGNEGPGRNTVGYPAKYPWVVSVGAVDRDWKVTPFSSRGPRVDVAAPGDQILSSYPPAGVAALSGTSMAAPFVAGLAALAGLEAREFFRRVKATADDRGPDGRDHGYGAGIVNPARLLAGDDPVTLGAGDLTAAGRKKLAAAGAPVDGPVRVKVA